MAGILSSILTYVPSVEGDTMEQITSAVREWKRVTDPPPVKKYTSLKECLREMLFNADLDELNMYDLEANNWPQVKEDEDSEYEDSEYDVPLGMENHEVVELTETKLRISCGDDSQEPLILDLELVDGELTVTKSVEGYMPGMSLSKFKEMLLN